MHNDPPKSERPLPPPPPPHCRRTMDGAEALAKRIRDTEWELRLKGFDPQFGVGTVVTEPAFPAGAKGYIVGSDRCVGRFVGVNPETGSLVFVSDAEFHCYHPWQVRKEANSG